MDYKIVLTCPDCKRDFGVYMPEEDINIDGSLMDCPYCESELTVQKGIVYNFHKWMHTQNNDWPEDGKGTYHLDC